MIPVIVLAIGFFAISGPSVSAQDSVPISLNTEKLVNEIYKPSFYSFAESARLAAQESEGLCDRAAASSVYGLQTTFSNLVTEFSRIELYRLGPLLENELQHSLFYWPDKRRVGERQLRQLLADPEIQNLDANGLSEKSVALQGFTALERLLFLSTYLPIETMPQCHVAQVVIQNIAAMATQLNRTWSNESSIVDALLEPNAESVYFRDEKEVVRSVMTQIIIGLDTVLNKKLLPFQSEEIASVKKAPLWISQRTLAMLRGNLASIEALLFHSELIADTRLEKQLRNEFNYVNYLLGKSASMVKYSDEDGRLTAEADVLFNSLSAVVSSIAYLVNTQMPRLLGVVVFNSSEGD